MTASPKIDIVIIGLNSEKTIHSCLESVRRSQYPQESLTITYSDGGSSDSSVRIAETFGCQVARVEAETPTPGRQRNEGWRLGSAPYVQFLDSDTVMDPAWLRKGIAAIGSEGVGAVMGDRRELRPDDSAYNKIGDLEWNARPGEADCFGGDVLISRAALEASGGYDPGLIAGEDPELSYRVRKAGFKIIKLDSPMTRHDLAMYAFKQYWKRSFRSGHAFAEIHAMHPDFWGAEVRRVAIRALPALLTTILLPLAWRHPSILVAWAASAALLLRPRILLVDRFKAEFGIPSGQAKLYAWHASLVVVPQFFGMLRFYAGKAFSRPLTNKKFLRIRAGATV
jgi:glycosyltransferase involved in cell wall biosynthesis